MAVAEDGKEWKRTVRDTCDGIPASPPLGHCFDACFDTPLSWIRRRVLRRGYPE